VPSLRVGGRRHRICFVGSSAGIDPPGLFPLARSEVIQLIFISMALMPIAGTALSLQLSRAESLWQPDPGRCTSAILETWRDSLIDDYQCLAM